MKSSSRCQNQAFTGVSLHQTHHRTVDALKSLKTRPEVQVTVCFGKADGVYERVPPDALALLKELPNIRIVYEERLHAKFYGNDEASLITS